MSKSHVGMGFKVCPICYEKHDEVVLLDRRLINSLEHDNFMGYDLCPKHQAMTKDFLALVETENLKNSNNLQPKDAKPSGQYAHLKRHVVEHIFTTKIPDDMPFIYVEKGVIDMLKQRMTPEGEGA